MTNQFSVSIQEPDASRGKEREVETGWQKVEESDHRFAIWRPTQEEEFLAYPSRPDERQKEGVFIYPESFHAPDQLYSAQIISRGKAEVFFIQNDTVICLIPRSLPITKFPGIILVPAESMGFEKQSAILFQHPEQAELFVRVNGKLTTKAKIEFQEIK